LLELVKAGFYVCRSPINGHWVVTLGPADREPSIICTGSDISVVADEALAALRKIVEEHDLS